MEQTRGSSGGSPVEVSLQSRFVPVSHQSWAHTGRVPGCRRLAAWLAGGLSGGQTTKGSGICKREPAPSSLEEEL